MAKQPAKKKPTTKHTPKLDTKFELMVKHNGGDLKFSGGSKGSKVDKLTDALNSLKTRDKLKAQFDRGNNPKVDPRVMAAHKAAVAGKLGKKKK